MKISFRIKYRTQVGESVRVVLRGDENSVVELSTCDGELWEGSISREVTEQGESLEYSYEIYRGAEMVRREMLSVPHAFELDQTMVGGYDIEDCWRDLPSENYRYSAAFNPFVEAEPYVSLSEGRYVTLRLLAPAFIREGLRPAVVGSGASLVGWEDYDAKPMREIRPNLWSVTLPIAEAEHRVEYKFMALDATTGEFRQWECGANRVAYLKNVEPNSNYLVAECEPNFELSTIRIAGSAIPVFSLRSEGGCGIGDFGDLKGYIRWAAQTRQQAVQILPINDTTINNTWQDSYPYNSISIYAFHPVYIDLRALPELNDRDEMEAFERQRVALNALSAIDYESVSQLKHRYIRLAYNQEGEQVLRSEAFKSFFEENSHWLRPYAAFSFLRDESGSANFSTWTRCSVYNEAEIASLCSPEGVEYPKIALYYYMQYLLHVQLLDAANTARRLGVILKGDIPIGISRESVEAWVEPHYFNMNGQAGAPPDAFSVNGQNWGFPTYNWEVMQRDNYQWWRRRFAKMAEYFTAYRIDHILGFFRIWEIPQHSVHGLLGQFAPAMPMSMEQIEGWGLSLDREFMTEPFINDALLDEIFGERGDMVRETFVRRSHYDVYAMREEFATQRQVEAYFKGKDDEESLRLKESLYSLISNVLFVKDHHDETMYHPRISVQDDYVFRQLSNQEREAFNRLYNHYYYERHNGFWYREAMKKLPVLTSSTSMLVCGEDLGMVPDCVAPVMRELQIISLEIERMPKDPNDEFGHPAKYPYSSVCTIGTHDMSTLRGWWREDDYIRDRYHDMELCRVGEIPLDASATLCEEVIRRHLESPSILVILTWQDWLSVDETLRNPDIEGERINIPANPRHYWRWRMHLSIEDLMGQVGLNEAIEGLISSSSR